ncbi:hypothetical protein IFM89_001870 [Coptis chinensis]|uniref:RING-type domain-containing protein n=1 Tax=Coptis chinensis TaxID=261450 RepID=A0A835HI70_9MAGN|nr:hypothetical protein IFM89_001870 [Coptis chinensis]
MGIEVSMKRRRFGDGVVFILCIFVSLLFSSVESNVVLIGRNVTLSLESMEANFAVQVKNSGECGVLYIAEPIDACSPLTNKIVPVEGAARLPYVLIVRGGCTFEDKVRRAQNAGFEAAIVYDNEHDDRMIAIIMIIVDSGTCTKHRIRRDRPRAPRVREFHGMSSRLVRAMPSLIFTAVLEDNSTSRTCSICLEDYIVGERIRILPCRHKFHATCVDAWLTSWRTFCPVCKRDARTGTSDPPASESTPLLSSTPASLSSAASLSSVPSSLATSSAIHIGQASSQSHSLYLSHDYSLSSTPYLSQSRRSYSNSPALSQSRSSVDLRNASSQRSYASQLVASQSLGYPSLSPLNSRYISPYLPSSSNASPSYVGSSSRQPYLLHCSESATSFSPFASAQSLPGVDPV